MHTCKEVIDLASKRLISKLKWQENLGFRLHLIICRTCVRYTKQLEFISRASAQLDEQFRDTKLSVKARKRIIHNLSKQQSNIE